MLFSLVVFPYVIVYVGIRGAKAPSYLSKILIATDGHVPLLLKNEKYHFFLSKHEKYKKVALEIANALIDANFKVWISQYEKDKGHSTDKHAMQTGVETSASMLLLLTPEIFCRDRFWVTQTEIMYGLEECKKPLLCISPSVLYDEEKGFDFDTKCHNMSGHVHPQECCCDVEDSFQPYARAIPVSIDVASWNISGKITVDAHHYVARNQEDEDVDEEENLLSISMSKTLRRKATEQMVCDIVKRFLNRESARNKLMKEVKCQKLLGVCGGSEHETKEEKESESGIEKGTQNL